ncbi:SDR family NAD(P)-dependent oxidoreductase [Mucilaginibacter sabulilitoris]|uniref:SDR family NAD(P)-dependent oxidoreductase n=1 Tax=Mucilaginibacter sabulilitoris TaxID=1173583 RepID=A0ABZ0U0N1_9SPHI|nr:SDR family NAD(P)-dependent oxidoreductase [Mucilaginibacter sabulilitoris]WPU96940.1 SDR family NAD(P)-dependent oxidoreductase [Mucilaginibacter sabulilitoris]
MSKTIIVTGATSSYGRAIIQTLADEGHGVVAIVDPLNELNMAAAKELRQTANVELVEVDIRNDASVKLGLSSILKRYGHIDVLISNEGPIKIGLAENTSIEQYEETFNVNVYGVLRVFRSVLPTMRKNRCGLLINVNSGVCYFAAPFITALSMAKAGLEMLIDGILSEVQRFGIENVSVWTGYYPAEVLSNLEKIEDISIYDEGGLCDEQAKLKNKILEGNKQGKVHSQSVAALVLELINMSNGTRPRRCSLNPHLAEAESRYANAKRLGAEGWDETYGVK